MNQKQLLMLIEILGCKIILVRQVVVTRILFERLHFTKTIFIDVKKFTIVTQ